MKQISYITVSTADYNNEDSQKNIQDVMDLINRDYTILSAVGDGAGSVHYILAKPTDPPRLDGLPLPRRTRITP